MADVHKRASVAVAAALSLAVTSAVADTPTVRVGALQFGTVNWELDTIT